MQNRLINFMLAERNDVGRRVFFQFQQEIQSVDAGLAVERGFSIFENIAAGCIDESRPVLDSSRAARKDESILSILTIRGRLG